MQKVAQMESGMNTGAIGDKNYVCKEPTSPLYGQVSPSYGVLQINRCWHYALTIEELFDPYKSIAYAYTKNPSLWTTARQLGITAW